MPALYVVATPIGNLQDMSPRAVDTLKAVALIAAEDTRVTMKLCQVFDIHVPLVSCHRHSEEQKAGGLIRRMMEENFDMALVTDAGTPCVSDPGDVLVREAIVAGVEVIPVPGCCAAAAALSVSGFDTREWAFYGFLPREKKALREKLLEIARGVPVAVVHESPHRVKDLLACVAETLPGCRVSVSCDLTKLHEKTVRGTAEEALALLEDNPKAEKGEYCLVLDMHGVDLPRSEEAAADIPLAARLMELMVTRRVSLREAQRLLAESGFKKNAVKAAALEMKKAWEDAL